MIPEAVTPEEANLFPVLELAAVVVLPPLELGLPLGDWVDVVATVHHTGEDELSSGPRDEDPDPLPDVHHGHAPDPGRGLRLSSHPRIYHETNEVLKALVDVPERPGHQGLHLSEPGVEESDGRLTNLLLCRSSVSPPAIGSRITRAYGSIPKLGLVFAVNEGSSPVDWLDVFRMSRVPSSELPFPYHLRQRELPTTG